MYCPVCLCTWCFTECDCTVSSLLVFGVFFVVARAQWSHLWGASFAQPLSYQDPPKSPKSPRSPREKQGRQVASTLFIVSSRVKAVALWGNEVKIDTDLGSVLPVIRGLPSGGGAKGTASQSKMHHYSPLFWFVVVKRFASVCLQWTLMNTSQVGRTDRNVNFLWYDFWEPTKLFPYFLSFNHSTFVRYQWVWECVYII